MRVRMDWVVSEVRRTVQPSDFSVDSVFHYSIPIFDETGTGQFEPPDAIGSGKTLLTGGEVLISKLNPRKPRVLIAQPHNTPTVCSSEFVAVRPNGIVPRFLVYLLLAESTRQFLDSRVQSVTRSQQRVRPEEITKLWLDLPTVPAQTATAEYLDAETARIDALIAKKRRMIELLHEQAGAYAIRLVLGDVARDTETASPSGLYRLVPRGWKETALRHLGCHVQTGPFGSQLHAEDYVENGWPVVNPMNIVGGEIVAVEGMTISDEKRSELARHILRHNDIVFGRRGEMGRAGLVTEEQDGWLCGTGSLRLRLDSTYLQPPYLKLLLETPVARSYFELSSVGSTMDNLNSEIVLAFPALVPSADDQVRVVEAVRDRRRITETTSDRLGRQIELLVEHRQALITAAVTGVPDVAGVAS